MKTEIDSYRQEDAKAKYDTIREEFEKEKPKEDISNTIRSLFLISFIVLVGLMFISIFFPMNETYLFSTDTIMVEGNLNKSIISEELKNIFKTNEFLLSKNATIRKEKEDTWKITNEENNYIIKKEGGKLNIYYKNKAMVDLYRSIFQIVAGILLILLVIQLYIDWIKIEWGNTKEQLFYYLYASYENRDRKKAKTLLTSAIRKIEEIIENYKELPFSEKIVTELNLLHDSLKGRIYPSLDTQKPGKDDKTKGWKKVKDIAIDIIDDSFTKKKIKDFDSKLAELNFERKESVKLEDEKEPRWHILKQVHKEKYNATLTFRLIHWTIAISLIGYAFLNFFNLAISTEAIAGLVMATIVAATAHKEI